MSTKVNDGRQAEVLQMAFYRGALRYLSDFFDDVQRSCWLFRWRPSSISTQIATVEMAKSADPFWERPTWQVDRTLVSIG
ncbi:hypothetical protein JJB98_00125 [Bradyrhizobium diazoefficiens]|nr:hypothetical protein [Bradyrhizobium diazoefficiens]QQO18437.1 hypothetical protein JJB98_00125 [Bradyrhizobium diazoefficiens]